MTLTIKWTERRAIKWALDDDNMSGAELARKIGIDPTKLSRIISGEQKSLPIEELKLIAEGQGRPLSYYTETPKVHVMTSWDSAWFARPIDVAAAA